MPARAAGRSNSGPEQVCILRGCKTWRDRNVQHWPIAEGADSAFAQKTANLRDYQDRRHRSQGVEVRRWDQKNWRRRPIFGGSSYYSETDEMIARRGLATAAGLGDRPLAGDARVSRNRDKSIPGQFVGRLIEMLEAPAYRVLSLSAHRIISRVEIELGHHGGNDNGRLPVTFENFENYGIDRHSIAPAIREAEALGFLEITERGRAGNAEWRKPNYFRLTYKPAKGLPGYGTNEWRRFQTVEDAQAVAFAARHTPAKAKSQCGFLPKAGGKTPTEKALSIPGKPPLQAKVEKPPLLSISRVGVMAEPDREARPSGSAVASDPAPLERTEVVQNRIAKRLPDGWGTLGELPTDELARITELERAGELTDAALGLAVAAARMGKA